MQWHLNLSARALSQCASVRSVPILVPTLLLAHLAIPPKLLEALCLNPVPNRFGSEEPAIFSHSACCLSQSICHKSYWAGVNSGGAEVQHLSSLPMTLRSSKWFKGRSNSQLKAALHWSLAPAAQDRGKPSVHPTILKWVESENRSKSD